MSGAEREGFGTVREHRTHIIYPDQEGPHGRNPISFTKIWGGGGNRDGFGMLSGRFGDIEPISFTPIRRDPAGETPYHLPRSWQKSLHSGPPKRRKSHVLSRIFATFGLKKHRTHIIYPDQGGPPAQNFISFTPISATAEFGDLATTRPAVPTLPSRAHLQD